MNRQQLQEEIEKICGQAETQEVMVSMLFDLCIRYAKSCVPEKIKDVSDITFGYNQAIDEMLRRIDE